MTGTMPVMRFALIVGGLACIGSCDCAEAETLDGEPKYVSMPLVAPEKDDAKGEVKPLPLHPRSPEEQATPKAVQPASPWENVPYQCETFTVQERSTPVWSKKLRREIYPVRYKRDRQRLKYADQKKNYALARMVATEMGFDPALVEMHADHESSGRPDVIHILNPDRAANKRAMDKYAYSTSKEAGLERELAKHSVSDRSYWKVKAKLAAMRLYKGNPHWNTRLKYEHHLPKRGEAPAEMWEESQSVWSYGYGFYGMNAVLYTHVWDSQAPPWIMCAEQGIVATIMYVWVARDAKAKCDQLSARDPETYTADGGSNRGIIRRMAKGQCGKGRLGPVWRRLMGEYKARYGIDWDAPAKVGSKWPQYELYRNGNPKRDKDGNRIPTDREKILKHMVKKAEARGLLRPYSRPDGTQAKLVRRRP